MATPPRLEALNKLYANTLIVVQRDAERMKRVAEAMPDIVADAAREMAPIVRRVLVRNLDASLVYKAPRKRQHRYGTLRAAVANADVEVSVKRNNVFIRISLQSGLPKQLYVYAGALNAGAVRAPHREMELVDTPTGEIRGTSTRSVIGARAKRSIKKAALSGTELGKRTAAFLKRGSYNAARGVDVRRGPVDAGAVSVIPPKPFFFLTPGQRQGLAQKLTSLIQQRVDKLARS